MLLLCGLLCTGGAAALTQVAGDGGPGVYDKSGTTLYASDLTVWKDGDSATVYEGDDLTVTLTLAYIDGADLFVDTSDCTMSIAGPSGSYYVLPDADESDSEAGRVNPECDGEVGVIFDANGGDALICPSGDPVSLVYHIPGDYLPVAGTWTVTPKWSAGLFTDTDGTAYDVSFTVKEFTYIPLFTPTYAYIYTPTPTYIQPTPTPTSFWYATPTYTKIPTPGGTVPAGIPTPTSTATPTVTPTTTSTAEPTAVPTTAATGTATPAATATAGATASPTASTVPTTAPTGTSTPGDTSTPATKEPTAAGTTTSMTHVPTDATDTPVPRGTPYPTIQGPQGTSFGWIFGLAILAIVVAAGGYLLWTRNKGSTPESPAEEVAEPEDSVAPEQPESGEPVEPEQPDDEETKSE